MSTLSNKFVQWMGRKPVLKHIKNLIVGDEVARVNIKQLNKQIDEEKTKQAKEPEVGWNIYNTSGDKEPARKLVNRLGAVHILFKGRILRVGTWVARRVLNKHYRGVPDTPVNQNLAVFDRAYERTISEWHHHVLANAYRNPERKSKVYWDHIAKDGPSAQTLRTAKETALFVALNDTAYRNFMDMLMYNIHSEMNKEYAGKGIPQHLIYTSSDIADPNYYYLHTCLKQGKVRVVPTNQMTCCEFQAVEDAQNHVAEGVEQDTINSILEAEKNGQVLSSYATTYRKEVERIRAEQFAKPAKEKSALEKARERMKEKIEYAEAEEEA